ncbi:hypothetical protein DFJ77DRAFT_244133 [Powellomyces hirtus]|nr:hypothetical protein DFJ77DRAFT_244133 [Powellomyces hirtus]
MPHRASPCACAADTQKRFQPLGRRTLSRRLQLGKKTFNCWGVCPGDIPGEYKSSVSSSLRESPPDSLPHPHLKLPHKHGQNRRQYRPTKAGKYYKQYTRGPLAARKKGAPQSWSADEQHDSAMRAVRQSSMPSQALSSRPASTAVWWGVGGAANDDAPAVANVRDLGVEFLLGPVGHSPRHGEMPLRYTTGALACWTLRLRMGIAVQIGSHRQLLY